MFKAHSASWLQQAQALAPRLSTRQYHPTAVVAPHHDATAFQGWGMHEVESVDALEARLWHVGESVVLDFGEHLVGQFSLAVRVSGVQDAPVRLKLVFGEVPAEVAEPFASYTGELSRAWLQDVVITLDELPQIIRLPRRYAFRYVRITWEEHRNAFNIGIRECTCHAVTSAEFDLPPADYPAPYDAIDRTGSRTLRNCMQDVFEDGPKRDRRLWLGDLRVMAQTKLRDLPELRSGQAVPLPVRGCRARRRVSRWLRL